MSGAEIFFKVGLPSNVVVDVVDRGAVPGCHAPRRTVASPLLYSFESWNTAAITSPPAWSTAVCGVALHAT
ncbi:hypothetical protein WI69_01500 [Burkholderia diffusa]|uniref:hypothetical protein n=1 Tax=Burkholderia diffusa TaxID=488732 RepID=UPI00076C4DDA|nr:hypothetical protein [Burkholderia diffusa]KVC09677.1 hypothetical protein WI69_01500 [Burkholderia diffusa]